MDKAELVIKSLVAITAVGTACAALFNYLIKRRDRVGKLESADRASQTTLPIEWQVNDPVEGYWGDGKWFRGTIAAALLNGKYRVRYDDRSSQLLSVEHIRHSRNVDDSVEVMTAAQGELRVPINPPRVAPSRALRGMEGI